ncbi:hypothetical protein ACLMJK_003865 [Lecanora helva]
MSETNGDLGEVTNQLCTWIHHLTASDIPEYVLIRAKYLILDGVACAIVRAHLPWSELAANSVQSYEPAGTATVLGHDCKLGPLAATVLNSSFIQGCELDDFHHEAPLHSESVILPTLFAAAEAQKNTQPPVIVSGSEFLIASVVGFEVGPRAGRALLGTELLSSGWHCGTVFGHPASAASASKLLGLDFSQIGSALGIACTQACGLMCAQYEGMVKRMQHGFAARNGLQGALLAKGGYQGMKHVFERPYGGYLVMFSKGNRKEPAYRASEITRGLNENWDTAEVRVKSHACVGGAYGIIECIENLQKKYWNIIADLRNIQSIKLEVSKPLIGHCGWVPQRPITPTGAQMNAIYLAAVQFVDKQVLLEQFSEDRLNRDQVWDLVEKTVCVHSEKFDRLTFEMGATVTIELKDGRATLRELVEKPRGMDPPATNEEIVGKYRKLTTSLLTEERQNAIKRMILNIEEVNDVTTLTSLLASPFKRDVKEKSKI